MKRLLIIILSLPVLLTSCQQEAESRLEKTDLLPHGIPVTIMAPDSAEIKAIDMAGGLIKDVVIKGGEGYNVQIIASEAETTDIAKIKADQLANVKSNRYFSRIVEEEENGFIYETAIDSSHVSYGFRYIHVMGDQEIVFQSGLASTFDEEQARTMYKAVKQ
jgi:hypothetical protein